MPDIDHSIDIILMMHRVEWTLRGCNVCGSDLFATTSAADFTLVNAKLAIVCIVQYRSGCAHRNLIVLLIVLVILCIELTYIDWRGRDQSQEDFGGIFIRL